MLEAAQYTDNCFLTLTYDPHHLPFTLGDLATLAPEDLRNFFKRLRKNIEPIKIRYYAVGEYGDDSTRPHYHAAIFNLPTCSRGNTGLGMLKPDWSTCCPTCHMVGTAWGKGKVFLGILETSSAQYVAGYVTKKMTTRSDPRLRGREPEFARMSNRPGLAHSALHEIASQLLKFNLDKTQADVPVSLRHGKRELPLGRYLRRKLRLLIGKEEQTPEIILALLKEEMRPLQEAQFSSSQKKTSLQSVILEKNKGAIANFHAKQSLFKPRKNL